MTQRKGLSQILYLIIAASVLMMVALSLIFMFNDSVSPGDSNSQACSAAIDTQCSATGASSVSIPTTCKTTNSQGKEQFTGPSSYDIIDANQEDLSGATGVKCP